MVKKFLIFLENSKFLILMEIFIFAIFNAFIFVVVERYPERYMYVSGFFMVVLLYIYIYLRVKYRQGLFIKRATNELHAMTDDLSPSTNSKEPIPNELLNFYEELNTVKAQLEKKGRTRQELLDIANTVASFMEIEKLLQDLLPKLNEVTRSLCSAFYAINHTTNRLEIRHSIGFSKNIYGEFDLRLGEGFIGLAAAQKDIMLYTDLPDDTVYITRTFLGKIKPKSVMVVPITAHDQPAGVLVCASIYDYTPEDQDMVGLMRYYLGVAVSNGINFEKIQRLANELTFQNKLIQEQYEDMKKRLDEKSHLLSSWANHRSGDYAFALDARGNINIWGREAKIIHGIGERAVLGKPLERIYEENHWPPLNKAFETTLQNGTHKVNLWLDEIEYEYKMDCVYNDQNDAIGVMVAMNEIIETVPGQMTL